MRGRVYIPSRAVNASVCLLKQKQVKPLQAKLLSFQPLAKATKRKTEIKNYTRYYCCVAASRRH